MARPLVYDQNVTVPAAIDCLWTNGYERTTTRQIADQMGVSAASLYHMFGSKQGLLLRALEWHFANSTTRRLEQLESSQSAAAGLRQFFDEVVRESVKDCRGCFLVNTAIEVAPHDKEAAKIVADAFSEIRSAFQRTVTRFLGGRAGPGGRSPDELAWSLFNLLMSLRVMARSGADRRTLQVLVRTTLAFLEEPLPSAPRTGTKTAGRAR